MKKVYRIATSKIPLILREIAAIRIRLSHASQGDSNITSILLSNTSIICPLVRDTLGKLRLKPDRENILECGFP